MSVDLVDRIEDWMSEHDAALYDEYMRLSTDVPLREVAERARQIAVHVLFSGHFDDKTGAEAQAIIARRLVAALR